MRLIRNKYLQYLLVGLVFLLPVIIRGVPTATVTLAASMVYTAIAGLGINVLLGYSGQISLGHAAFMGLSAYLSAYLTKQLELPFLLSIVIAVAAPLVIGLIVGAIAVRLEGFYLAIATLGFGEILRQLFIEMDWFTGGFSGASAKYPTVFGYTFNKTGMYVFMVALLVVLMMLVYNLVHSSTGRAMIAMKSSRSAAMAMGVNVFRYKLISFAISSVFAGIAGVCYVHFFRHVDPTVWTAVLSLNLIAIVVIGGTATVGGAVVGAVVMHGLPELLKDTPIIGEIAGLPFVLVGCLMVVILIFYPRGLIHIPRDVIERIQKRAARAGKKEA
jgi:branched-chain amino acid transport system permease protein